MSQSQELPVTAEIRQLAELPLNQLRERWAEMFRVPPPAAAKSDYLVRAMAYRIQALAEGSVSSVLQRRLQKLMSGAAAAPANGSPKDLSLSPGSRLLREWQGKTHKVLVVDGGYRHRDVTYKSFSEVARAITGTRWSGPLFFGLKTTGKRAPEKPKPTFVVDLSSRPKSNPEARHGF
ncbi:MAG: DUF2924 domain-containing protein [Rhodospirillaceae bacterium]|nr:DUF2924 domain-containing protein [Rhodospirillaceae bacterium]